MPDVLGGAEVLAVFTCLYNYFAFKDYRVLLTVRLHALLILIYTPAKGL